MNSTLVSDAREVANRLVRVLGFALHLAAPCINKRLNLGRLDLARALLLVMMMLLIAASPSSSTAAATWRNWLPV